MLIGIDLRQEGLQPLNSSGSYVDISRYCELRLGKGSRLSSALLLSKDSIANGGAMIIQSMTHQLQTDPGIGLYQLDDVIQQFLLDSKLQNGLLTVTSRHTTTALAINEYESRLLDDVREYFGHLVPAEDKYLHNDIHLRDCPENEPENAHAHIQAMLLSSSEVIPVTNAELQLGQWQSVIFFDLDGPRERQISIQVMGE